MTNRRWRIRPHDPGEVSALSLAMNVPPLVATLLAARGLREVASARSFLEAKLSGLHDPALLPGAEKAAARLADAARNRRPIVVYGDYDADGVCGAAILTHALRLCGAEVSYYVPHRLDEGYGLNCEALTQLKEQGAAVVVTVDCGIASVAEARFARELGLELIVTDHHQFGVELPAADVLVHPRLPGGGYPFGELSGAGVAFKVAWALGQKMSDARRVSPAMREFLLGAVALAALGTVADVVPLVDENRVIVRHGLNSLRNHGSPGLKALLASCAVAGKPALSAEDIGFSLAPRINAVGRLGEARLAVELLTTTSPERAKQLADHLNEQNQLRQQVERRITQEARELAEPFLAAHAPALVLCSPDWHAGVIGIVAGKLAEKYHRPVILLAVNGDLVQGSGRSPDVNLYDALHACSECLQTYGGHAAAAGLKLRPERVDEFRSCFCDFVQSALPSVQRPWDLAIDAEVPLHLLTYPAVRGLESLAPFGAGNPRPVFAASGVRLAAPPKAVGQGEHHLSLQLVQHGARFRAIAFGQAPNAKHLARCSPSEPNPPPLAVAFSPVLNTYQGRTSVDLHIKDWRIDGADEAAESTPRAQPAVCASS